MVATTKTKHIVYNANGKIKRIMMENILASNQIQNNDYDFIDRLLTNDIVINIKQLLGLDFYGLYDYFKQYFFEFSSNQFTIIVSRRCIQLAMWFLFYINKYDEDINKCSLEDKFQIQTDAYGISVSRHGYTNCILSDKARLANINQYILKSNKNIEIFIMDDICIHGKTLDTTKTMVLKSLGDLKNKQLDNVKTVVYMSSNESNLIKPFSTYSVSHRAGWRELSRKIVDVINYLNFPYVSYLNSFMSFYIKNAQIDKIKQKNGIICREFGDDVRKKGLWKRSFFIVERNPRNLKYEYLKCVRLYFSSKLKSFLFIPYVILDSIHEKIKEKSGLINLLSQYLRDEIAGKVFSYIECFYSTDNRFIGQEEDEIFIYNLLSCIASQAYGIYFVKKYFRDVTNLELWNRSFFEQDVLGCLVMAFGKHIADIIKDAESFKSNSNARIDDNGSNENLEIDESNYSQNTFNKLYNIMVEECIQLWRNKEMGVIKYNSLSETIYKLKTRLKCSTIEYDYMLLCAIVSLCDIGEMNINGGVTSELNENHGDIRAIECTSILKAGELGFMGATGPKGNKRGLESLLNNKYYRLLLS